MYSLKAEFFDTQVEKDWAALDYGEEKMARIDRMLSLARVQPGMRILEPGCGTGRLTRILDERIGPSGNLIALDISKKMIDACLRNTSWKAHVQVACASVEEYPLPQRSFDAILCHQVFPHFDDKRRVLKLFAALLKSSGNLALFHFAGSAAINQVHRKAHAAVRNDLIPPEKAMRSMLRSAGFEIDRLEDQNDEYLLISHLIR